MAIDRLPGSAGTYLIAIAGLVLGLNTESSELPTWVTAPPTDSDSAIYGIGDGEDRDTAKSAALAAIAGSLLTTVQGSTSVNQRQDRSGFTEQVEVIVKTQIRETALSHYKVIESARTSRRWWVLIELDREALRADTLSDLQEADTSLSKAMARFRELSRLEQYLAQEELLNRINKTRADLEFARSVSHEFRGEETALRLRDYNEEVTRLSRQLAIRVGSDAITEEFAKKLVSLFAKRSIRARVGGTEAGWATVELSGEQRKANIGSSKQVKISVLLTTTDDWGKQMASVESSAVGESLSSYESAQRQASNKLGRVAESQGIFRFLGLQMTEKK